MKKSESVACANAELVTNNDPLQSTSAEKRIFTLRGVEVILDKDLAELYHVETKRLNEQVRRNSERFPPEFMFQLTKEEWDSLRSQNATKNGRGQHTKYAPYAFTEHGVIMLAALLKSDVATKASVVVVKAMPRFSKGWTGLSINYRSRTISLKIFIVNWKRNL